MHAVVTIELPPCPDCGSRVEDLHVTERMVASAGRFTGRVDLDVGRTTELLPCKCPVKEYRIEVINGRQAVTKIAMVSGWTWALVWEGPIPEPVAALPLGQDA